MASASTYHPPLTTRQLLVSVQNADEALLAFQCGVPWVDLKNPSTGALGQPTTDTCQAFIEVAHRFPGSQISLALGEIDRVNWDWAARWLPEFAVGKVGLAGHAHVPAKLIDRLESFPGQIVPALYADWERAASAPPATVIEVARALHAPFVLIDTFTKDGRGLFEWLSREQLRELQSQTEAIGAALVVAGSLRPSDWPALEQLTNLTIGIRGAACQQTADRTSRLNPAAIDQWLKWCRGECVRC